MKKILALILALLMMTVMLVSCGDKVDTPADDTAPDSGEKTDLEYVLDKGVLVVGITDFAPMDYEDDNGNWIGFDADMAKAFAESLGVEVEFVEIEWGSKVMELDGKTIDCVWNGMTLTDEVKSAMECSKPYCNNAQVVIVNKDVAENYKTAEDCKELNFAVEDGSAGQEMATENGFTYTAVLDQATALFEVSSGTCDAAIIDSLMAAAMVGEGTGYESLTYTVSLNSEEYGVGFRKGSELAEKLNAFFDAALADGTMEECAETYGVQAALIK
ncbi:MAG: transporter substrate-binding domain-containing protein [Clostridia bacterium]|nr:transporter substrate-binding domain-containing protein [Clostridia bacterium]